MKIVLDAGHGGQDGGGQSLTKPEKDIVLMAQSLLWKELADRGHTCLPTRVIDEFIPLDGRARYANEHKADLFVSLHANASGNPNAKGAWTLYAAPSPTSRAIANKVQKRLQETLTYGPQGGYPDDSPYTGGRRLAVLRQTKMPAILVELGFMTNHREAVNLTDVWHLQGLCRAVAKGLGD